jgi:HK97 family phage portal protein
MRIFGFNLNLSREPASRQAQAGGQIMQRSAPYSVQDWLHGKDVDRPVLTNAYQQSAWVYRAVNVLAEQVANIPFLFSSGDRGRENLITTGPLPAFYDRPHPHINRFQYWELRVIWLMLRGECFRIPIYEPGMRRRLKHVLMLDPAHFHHIIRDHELVGWRYSGFGPQAPLAAQVFLPEEVWFERLPNPFDFWRGLPPLYAAAMAARTDYAAAAFMRGIIENNCDTGLIVRTEKALAPEQEQQMLAEITKRKRSAGVADRPLLLSGVSQIIKPELSSADLQFLENRKFTRGEICAAFGVPEEILTATDHAKYDVMQGARLNFIENRVAPLCRRLEAEEETAVTTLDPSAVGWFDLDSLPIMQQAQRNRLVTARTAFEMGVPFNELNRVLDLGFKRLPWGDKGYVAGTMQNVGEASVVANPGRSAGAKANGPHHDAIGRALEWFEQSAVQAPKEPEPAPVPVRIVTNAAPGKAAASADQGAQKKLRRFLFEQRIAVLKRLNELSAACDGKIDEFRASDLFDVPAENARLAVLSKTLSLDLAHDGGLNQRTFDALETSLKRAQEQSESFEQFAARVRTLYNEAAEAPGNPKFEIWKIRSK